MIPFQRWMVIQYQVICRFALILAVGEFCKLLLNRFFVVTAHLDFRLFIKVLDCLIKFVEAECI